MARIVVIAARAVGRGRVGDGREGSGCGAGADCGGGGGGAGAGVGAGVEAGGLAGRRCGLIVVRFWVTSGAGSPPGAAGRRARAPACAGASPSSLESGVDVAAGAAAVLAAAARQGAGRAWP